MVHVKGKKTLVTGGSYGIGFGYAEALLKAGGVVAVNSRKEVSDEHKTRLDAAGEWHHVPGDMASEAGARRIVEDAFDKLGGLDALINNAGTYADPPDFMDATVESFNRTFDLNVKGYFFASQEFAKLVGPRDFDASIIHVGSTNSLQAEKNSVIYDTSKGAILMMVRSMAVTLAEKGIRVNGLGPGFIKTPLTGGGAEENPALVALLERQIPVGRIGEIEDCAGAAVFLISDAARYVTGQFLCTDGGIVAQQMIWE